MVKQILALVAMLLLGGCQSYAPATNAPGQGSAGGAQFPATEDAAGAADGEPAAGPRSSTTPNAAVIALVERAQQQQDTLDFAAAAVSLERAIRIAPRDANLYFRLARVRDEQGKREQADQLCRKAIALANDTRYMELKCDALFGEL